MIVRIDIYWYMHISSTKLQRLLFEIFEKRTEAFAYIFDPSNWDLKSHKFFKSVIPLYIYIYKYRISEDLT